MSKIKNPELYRCKLSCQLGKDVLNGKTDPPLRTSETQYALYNLLSAIEDLALFLERKEALAKKEDGK